MALKPRATTILEAVLVALRTPNGTGSYNYDLSATGRVQLGDPTNQNPGEVPCVWLVDTRIEAPEWADLGTRFKTLYVTLNLFAGGDTAETRHSSLLALASDIELALSTNPTFGLSNVEPYTQGALQTIDGLGVGYQGYMVGIMAFAVRYFAGPGVGL